MSIDIARQHAERILSATPGIYIDSVIHNDADNGPDVTESYFVNAIDPNTLQGEYRFTADLWFDKRFGWQMAW